MASVTAPSVPMFPKIDFSGLDLNTSNGKWDLVGAQVMEALRSHGFFEAVFDEASPQKFGRIFGEPLKELFAVPLENKMKLGYSYINSPTFEVLLFNDPLKLDAIQSFTNTMWPQGNPDFSNVMTNILEPLSYLELMIRKMVFEGLGIGKHYESHLRDTVQNLGIVGYKLLKDHETTMNMDAHMDPNLLSLVYQHDDEGLEILTREGPWHRASPRTITILAAESLKALANGRLTAAVHRVKMMKDGIRYSIGLGSRPVNGVKIDAPEELINEEHPKLYKPYEYEPYLQYRVSTGGMRFVDPLMDLHSVDPLKDYCGIGVEDKML